MITWMKPFWWLTTQFNFFISGLLNGGKNWFTETLHFRTNSDSDNGGAGTFEKTTQKETLSLVFEQLHLRRFSFHLVLTPFKEGEIFLILFLFC